MLNLKWIFLSIKCLWFLIINWIFYNKKLSTFSYAFCCRNGKENFPLNWFLLNINVIMYYVSIHFSGFLRRRRIQLLFFKYKIILMSYFKENWKFHKKCSLKCFFYAQNLILCGRATLCISFIWFSVFFSILLLLLSSSIFGTVPLITEILI